MFAIFRTFQRRMKRKIWATKIPKKMKRNKVKR